MMLLLHKQIANYTLKLSLCFILNILDVLELFIFFPCDYWQLPVKKSLVRLL